MNALGWTTYIVLFAVVIVFFLIMLYEWHKERTQNWKKWRKFKREHQHLSSWELFIRWFFEDYEE